MKHPLALAFPLVSWDKWLKTKCAKGEGMGERSEWSRGQPLVRLYSRLLASVEWHACICMGPIHRMGALRPPSVPESSTCPWPVKCACVCMWWEYGVVNVAWCKVFLSLLLLINNNNRLWMWQIYVCCLCSLNSLLCKYGTVHENITCLSIIIIVNNLCSLPQSCTSKRSYPMRCWSTCSRIWGRETYVQSLGCAGGSER